MFGRVVLLLAVVLAQLGGMSEGVRYDTVSLRETRGARKMLLMWGRGAPAGELLVNGGFEWFIRRPDDDISDTFVGWTNNGVDDGSYLRIEATAAAQRDNYALQMEQITPTDELYIAQQVTVKARTWYALTFYVKTGGVSAARYAVWDVTNGQWIVPLTEVVTGAIVYVPVSVEFQTPAGCTTLEVRIYGTWQPV